MKIAVIGSDYAGLLATVRQVLERLDLTLNETKTRIVDARQESFNFLGFTIRVSKSWKSGKSYPLLPLFSFSGKV